MVTIESKNIEKNNNNNNNDMNILTASRRIILEGPPMTNRSVIEMNREHIRQESLNEYYANSYRNSIIQNNNLNRSEYGNNADSILSLYNKIPESKNIVFQGSDVS